jgi:hypothetical protein
MGSESKPEPIVLVNQATGKVAAFACGKCRKVASSPVQFGGDPDMAVELARDDAREHCGPWFCECGAERRQNFTECEPCLYKRQAEEADAKEQARFDAAEKVSSKNWTGEYVWSDRFEELFSDIDELLGRYEDEGEEPPEYVWECEEEVLTLDGEDILHDALEREGGLFMLEHMAPVVAQDLQAALDGWLKKHPVRWWKEAHRRAVLLKEAT